jgi:hypothetical protein
MFDTKHKTELIDRRVFCGESNSQPRLVNLQSVVIALPELDSGIDWVNGYWIARQTRLACVGYATVASR